MEIITPVTPNKGCEHCADLIRDGNNTFCNAFSPDFSYIQENDCQCPLFTLLPERLQYKMILDKFELNILAMMLQNPIREDETPIESNIRETIWNANVK